MEWQQLAWTIANVLLIVLGSGTIIVGIGVIAFLIREIRRADKELRRLKDKA